MLFVKSDQQLPQDKEEIIKERDPRKLSAVVDYGLVFVGDLLPYGVLFLLTVLTGFRFGIQAAGFWSLCYAYVAIITTLICGPNLLSLRRRMPSNPSPGAVIIAGWILRLVAIGSGVALLLIASRIMNTGTDLIPLMSLLFVARFVETSIDGPATGIQYLYNARSYFLLRLTVFLVIIAVVLLGVFGTDSNSGQTALIDVATAYLVGACLGFLVTLFATRTLFIPAIVPIKVWAELRGQSRELAKFVLATVLFLMASRLHPVIISALRGQEMAGQFAMVQNLFAVLALASTGVAGVFFWSRNRQARDHLLDGVPWLWLTGAIVGGTFVGMIGAIAINYMYLTPLEGSDLLKRTAWIICLATPLILSQAILSNVLVLQKRDTEMLLLAAGNSLLSVLIIWLAVYRFGLLGAAASVSISAGFSSAMGIWIVRRKNG
ncbi:lipopolysaccharide biosynthesis protein [Thalassobius sp. Cn5-15]|uniref:lipopolysaccharide biosynthesis protein n=1 Tax=Thalassobius sp. Cn5-15 TaxID=2917763 RepID=UPI001EF1D245|nr:hypothetical protein [Thalassobius sp. Cn5-15]MCG7495013.1 hypothetical protein [Thalassobius sp. Cn5-15]